LESGGKVSDPLKERGETSTRGKKSKKSGVKGGQGTVSETHSYLRREVLSHKRREKRNRRKKIQKGTLPQAAEGVFFLVTGQKEKKKKVLALKRSQRGRR